MKVASTLIDLISEKKKKQQIVRAAPFSSN